MALMCACVACCVLWCTFFHVLMYPSYRVSFAFCRRPCFIVVCPLGEFMFFSPARTRASCVALPLPPPIFYFILSRSIVYAGCAPCHSSPAGTHRQTHTRAHPQTVGAAATPFVRTYRGRVCNRWCGCEGVPIRQEASSSTIRREARCFREEAASALNTTCVCVRNGCGGGSSAVPISAYRSLPYKQTATLLPHTLCKNKQQQQQKEEWKPEGRKPWRAT